MFSPSEPLTTQRQPITLAGAPVVVGEQKNRIPELSPEEREELTLVCNALIEQVWRTVTSPKANFQDSRENQALAALNHFTPQTLADLDKLQGPHKVLAGEIQSYDYILPKGEEQKDQVQHFYTRKNAEQSLPEFRSPEAIVDYIRFVLQVNELAPQEEDLHTTFFY